MGSSPERASNCDCDMMWFSFLVFFSLFYNNFEHFVSLSEQSDGRMLLMLGM